MKRFQVWRAAAVGLVLAMLLRPIALSGRDESTLAELKARLANANIQDRPPLCIRITELQLDEAAKLYAAGDSEKAKAALVDVVAFAELARDYAVQSHKHEKQCEISIRKLVRKLDGLMHSVSHDDQEQVQSVIDKLEHIRDDLLLAMFPKGGKK
jgi:enoyl-[acyl-carrier-protein] reductase (NADH)